MSIQTEFVSLIAPLVNGRVYPHSAPAQTLTPYVLYFRVSATPDPTLDANGGAPGLVNTRLQCDVWSGSYAEADATAIAIKNALNNWQFQNVLQDEQDFFEFDTRLHRVMIDVSIWHGPNP